MSTNSRYIIQDYISRPESIRNILSKLSWNDGIDTFFNHKVPFSYSTGKNLAYKFSKLILAYLEQSNKKEITILELGAGTGYLTKNVKFILSSLIKDSSINIKFIITDANPLIINQLKTSSNPDVGISYKCFNPLTDSIDSLGHVDIFLMCYLLDCFDTYHFETQTDKVFEWKIQSYIDSADYVIKQKRRYLNYLNHENLVTHVKNTLKNNETNSFQQLAHCIKESYKKTDLPDTHPVFTHNLANQLIKKYHSQYSHKFNLSLDCLNCMDLLLKHLNTSQLLIVYDFGHSDLHSLTTKKAFKATYGMCNFYSINFLHLNYISQLHNVYSHLTSYKNGDSQCMLFHKGLNFSKFNTVFNNLFNTTLTQSNTNILSKINAYSKRKKTILDLPSYIEKKVTLLKDFQQDDYEFNIQISNLLIDKGYYLHAHVYLDQLIKKYNRFARSAYFFKIKLLILENKETAIPPLLKSLDLTTLKHSGILYHLCLYYCKLERYEEFEKYFYRFIDVTDYFIPWRFFIILQYIYSIKNFNTKLNHLNLFLNQLIKANPLLLTEDIKTNLKKFMK